MSAAGPWTALAQILKTVLCVATTDRLRCAISLYTKGWERRLQVRWSQAILHTSRTTRPEEFERSRFLRCASGRGGRQSHPSSVTH